MLTELALLHGYFDRADFTVIYQLYLRKLHINVPKRGPEQGNLAPSKTVKTRLREKSGHPKVNKLGPLMGPAHYLRGN